MAGCFLLGIWSEAGALSITQKSTQRTIDVEPVRLEDRQFTFRLSGKDYTVALDTLAEGSKKEVVAWADSQQARQAGTGAGDEVNGVLGQELFAPGKSLWSENVEDVARRLNWEKESAGQYSSSYRFYPPAAYGFANAHPYCCTLYGDEEGRPSVLSFVFANKGDYGSNVGFGADHFKPKGDLPTPKSLDEAISNDAKAIIDQLSKCLGEPKEQRYGEKEDRRDVQRWDFEDTAFILSVREGEYVHLLVVPTEVAENEGRVDFIKDQDFRKYLMANIRKEPNGDTRLMNIPMVNQGPKGYCAPATFERAMRYMGVPADMYLLATLATSQGGGTNTTILAEESARIIRSKARRMNDLDLEKDLDMRYVQRYIDKGVPLLWQMCSLDAYNDVANRLTEERAGVKDFDQWARKIAAEAEEVVGTLSAESNYHICMIVGYNEKTNEIAVSDSWGPSYELRWVPLSIAQAVTTRGGFVIDL